MATINKRIERLVVKNVHQSVRLYLWLGFDFLWEGEDEQGQPCALLRSLLGDCLIVLQQAISGQSQSRKRFVFEFTDVERFLHYLDKFFWIEELKVKSRTKIKIDGRYPIWYSATDYDKNRFDFTINPAIITGEHTIHEN